MSSSSSPPLRSRPATTIADDWGSSLPELAGVTTAAMDPTRIEEAMREGYATGHAAGMADGYAAGVQQGEADGLARLEQDRRNLESALADLRQQLARLGEAETEIRAAFDLAVASTAFLMAEAIIGRELAVAADPGRDAIVRAFAVAPSAVATAVVRLHPSDVGRLGDISDIAPDVTLTVVPDPAIAAGSCILVMGDTTVDATIGAALQRVREVLA
jgi:flagellar assembly protein FliH